MTTETEFFTIGYQGRSLDEFCRVLKRHQVQRLIDIRFNPFSRKKGFSGKPLHEALRTIGVEYLHIKHLGTPPEIQKKLKRDGDRNSFQELFGEYLASVPETMEELQEEVVRSRSCLMCFERDVEDCHRNQVSAKLLRSLGATMTVGHL